MARATGRQRRSRQSGGNRSSAHEELELPLKLRGGRRRGAGRKPCGPRRRVSHGRRTQVSRHEPVRVTVRLREGLPSLRRTPCRKVLNRIFGKARDHLGLRLVHDSIQSNHLHLLVEAPSTEALSRAIQGLSVRIARGLNRLWGRRGRVLADRFHSRVLRTPREVRNALVYVLQNARKHGVRMGRRLDGFSSARWFPGWRGLARMGPGALAEAAVPAWVMVRSERVEPVDRR